MGKKNISDKPTLRVDRRKQPAPAGVAILRQLSWLRAVQSAWRRLWRKVLG